MPKRKRSLERRSWESSAMRYSLDPRRNVRRRAIHGDSARHAHSSDCHGIDPDHARRVEAVGVTRIRDRFASALHGTLFGLACHSIKNRMDHALRRYTNLDEMKRKW